MPSTIKTEDRHYVGGNIRAADGTSAEDRTVEIVWAAGADVRRYDYAEGGFYVERLSMDPAHIRMERFASGMSLLNAHLPFSMDDRLGVVLPGSVRIQNGRGLARVQLSRKPQADQLLQDVRDGMPFPISVGYRTHSYIREDGDVDGIPVLTAVDWEPMEISAVPVPADAGAHSLRSANPNETDLHSVPVTTRSETIMPNITTTTTESAVAAERARGTEIRFIGTRAGMDDAAIEAAVNNGTAIAEFRNAAFEAMAARQEAAPTFPHSPARGTSTTLDDPTNLARAMGIALANRGNSSIEVPPEARAFAHLSVVEMARAWCARQNIRVDGKTPSAVLEAALGTRSYHTTSDFSHVLVGSADVSLRRGYAQAVDELKNAASALTAQNFRDQGVVDAALAGGLVKVNEHGEYKRTTIRERKETYRIETFGRMYGVTRQLLVNDDIGALTNLPLAFGGKIRTFEASALAAVLVGNGVLSDGFPIFGSETGNLISGLLTVENIGKLRQVIRMQKGLDGEFLGLTPKFLIVGPSQETAAEKLLATVTASSVEAVNPFASRLTLLVEPRIEDDRFYLAADPATVQSLIYAHLSGQEGPVIESRAGWDVDGVEVKIRLDFGAAWLDRAGWAMGTGLPN